MYINISETAACVHLLWIPTMERLHTNVRRQQTF